MMRKHRILLSVGFVVVILGIFLLVDSGKAHVDDVVFIFLPLIFNGESDPISTTPSPTKHTRKELAQRQRQKLQFLQSPNPYLMILHACSRLARI